MWYTGDLIFAMEGVGPSSQFGDRVVVGAHTYNTTAADQTAKKHSTNCQGVTEVSKQHVRDLRVSRSTQYPA